MDYNCPENMVVELIANESLSELAKVMKDDDSYIKYNRGLTKKSIIAKAVKENYEKQLKTSINIRNVADWIIEFTDYLMGTHSYEFIENPYKVKEESVINDKNMFYAYIALSAKLQNEKNWRALLKEKMGSIDFSKKNPLWENIGLLDCKDAAKTLREKLYNLFN